MDTLHSSRFESLYLDRGYRKQICPKASLSWLQGSFEEKVSLGPFTLAKTKIQKTWVFCCTVYTARKTHSIRGFCHEKRMREKTWISYLCFGKWCACATSLYLWPYTCIVRITSRAAVGWFRWRSRTTWPKTRIIPARLEASVYIGKKPVKFRRSFKKSRCGGGFFDSGFLECLGEVA